MFRTALEGGSKWCHKATLLSSEIPPKPDAVWWETEDVFGSNYEMRLTAADPEKDSATMERLVEHEDVAGAMKIMAEKYPRHFANMMSENGDVVTADVFLQCVVFDKVIFD